MRVGTRANEGVRACEDSKNGCFKLSYNLLIVNPRANEPDRITEAFALPSRAECVDMVRANMENESENRDEVGTSGSRSNPETHIRAKASTLLLISLDADHWVQHIREWYEEDKNGEVFPIVKVARYGRRNLGGRQQEGSRSLHHQRNRIDNDQSEYQWLGVPNYHFSAGKLSLRHAYGWFSRLYNRKRRGFVGPKKPRGRPRKGMDGCAR